MARETSLKDQLTALHEPFRTQRSLYGVKDRVTELLKERHALLVLHRGADDDWGWGACASCKRNEKSYTECRGQGPLCLAHGADRPDAGATLPVGTRVQWSVSKSAIPVVGVVTAYDATLEEHSVDVGGEAEAAAAATPQKAHRRLAARAALEGEQPPPPRLRAQETGVS